MKPRQKWVKKTVSAKSQSHGEIKEKKQSVVESVPLSLDNLDEPTKAELKKSEEKKPTQFFIKSIRTDQFGRQSFLPANKSFRWFLYGITITDTTLPKTHIVRRPLRTQKEKGAYKLRREGIVSSLQSQYSKKEKQGYSKMQSLTYVNLDKGISPKAYDVNAAFCSILTGWIFKTEDVLPVRISKTDLDSYKRHYYFKYKEDAERGAILRKDKEFATLDELSDSISKDLKDHKSNISHATSDALILKNADNEVMGRAKQGNPCYFRDNLESKLQAQSRAMDYHKRLKAMAHENGSDENVKFPVIYYYLPSTSKNPLGFYEEDDQKKDLAEGLKSDKESVPYQIARFVELQQNDFTLDFKKMAYTNQEMNLFIKLAADLSWETGVLFYENFMKYPGYIDFLDVESMSLLYNCIPFDRREELFFKRSPNYTENTYFLFSLMNLDHPEEDVKLIVKLLEDPSFLIEPSIKNEQGEDLLKVAITKKIFPAIDILTQTLAYRHHKDDLLDLVAKTIVGSIHSGDVTSIVGFVERFDLNDYRFEDGNTLLHLAIYQGDYSISDLLMECLTPRGDEIYEYLSSLNSSGHSIFYEIANQVEKLYSKGREKEAIDWINLLPNESLSYLRDLPNGKVASRLFRKYHIFKEDSDLDEDLTRAPSYK